jgi:murein DD-endopeptidase MepM/ murein hydrolase activator NlpD
LLHKIRKLALVGLSVAAVAGCSGQPDDAAASPAWVGATYPATPAIGASSTAQPPSPVPASSAAPTTTTAATAATKVEVTYTFPVIGKGSYAHTHHDYPATDVITACGHRFVAVTSGVVLAVSTRDAWSPKVNAGATRGGLSVSIEGDDGVRYYGSHLSAIAAGITPGARVKTGQDLGKTGDTGDASACHLHFGISPPCAKQGDWWNQRGVIWPWPYLDSWRAGGQKSPVAEIKSWQTENGCPTKPRTDP